MKINSCTQYSNSSNEHSAWAKNTRETYFTNPKAAQNN